MAPKRLSSNNPGSTRASKNRRLNEFEQQAAPSSSMSDANTTRTRRSTRLAVLEAARNALSSQSASQSDRDTIPSIASANSRRGKGSKLKPKAAASSIQPSSKKANTTIEQTTTAISTIVSPHSHEPPRPPETHKAYDRQSRSIHTREIAQIAPIFRQHFFRTQTYNLAESSPTDIPQPSTIVDNQDTETRGAEHSSHKVVRTTPTSDPNAVSHTSLDSPTHPLPHPAASESTSFRCEGCGRVRAAHDRALGAAKRDRCTFCAANIDHYDTFMVCAAGNHFVPTNEMLLDIEVKERMCIICLLGSTAADQSDSDFQAQVGSADTLSVAPTTAIDNNIATYDPYDPGAGMAATGSPSKESVQQELDRSIHELAHFATNKFPLDASTSASSPDQPAVQLKTLLDELDRTERQTFEAVRDRNRKQSLMYRALLAALARLYAQVPMDLAEQHLHGAVANARQTILKAIAARQANTTSADPPDTIQWSGCRRTSAQKRRDYTDLSQRLQESGGPLAQQSAAAEQQGVQSQTSPGDQEAVEMHDNTRFEELFLPHTDLEQIFQPPNALPPENLDSARLLEIFNYATSQFEPRNMKQLLLWTPRSSVFDRYLQHDQILTSIFCVTEAIEWPHSLPISAPVVASELPSGCRSSLYRPTDVHRMLQSGLEEEDLRQMVRPNQSGEVDLGRALRPGMTLYLPFNISKRITRAGRSDRQLAEETNKASATAHWVLFVAEVPRFAGDGTCNTIMAPRMNYFDSLNPGKERMSQQTDEAAKRIARYLDWRHGPLHLRMGATCIRIRPPIPWLPTAYQATPQQQGGWPCGLHVILNAWCHALGLEPNPDFGPSEHFYESAFEVVNIAINGRASSDLLYAFLAGTRYVHPRAEGVPPGHRFAATIAFTNPNDVVDRYNQFYQGEHDILVHADGDIVRNQS